MLLRTVPALRLEPTVVKSALGAIAVTSCSLFLLLKPALVLSADAERGAELFNQKCSYCHSLSEQVRPKLVAPTRRPGIEAYGPGEPDVDWPVEVGKDKRGPHLRGLFGRAPGAVKDFPYRITLQTENPTWTNTDLDYWIYNHARLDGNERADLITYLRRATRQ